MASEVEICNRALQRLGATRITSLTEDSRNARSCNAAYVSLRDLELRSHTWNFAIARAELAADAVAPAWGRANSFQVPSDFLRLLPPYPEQNLNSLDWVVEGRKILTNDTAPIQIRYIARIEDPNTMDAAFREALSCKIAGELCEEITQSNTKKAGLDSDYDKIIRTARRTNGIEVVPASPPEDSWITGRQ